MTSSPLKLRLKILKPLRLRRALRLRRSGPGWTIASVVLLVVQGTLPLVSLYLMKLIVDAVAVRLASANKGVAFKQVAFFIILAGTVSLIGALCGSIAGLVSQAQAQVVTDHMYGILHAKSIEVDLEYYESSQYHDTLHRAQQEAPFRPTRIVNGLAQVAQNGISLLAVATLLFSFHWAFAAILFVATLPGVGVRLKYADQMYRWKHKRTSTERRAWYFGWMLAGDVHAKEIRLFDLGSLFTSRFRDLRSSLHREQLAIATRRSIEQMVTQASATLRYLVFMASSLSRQYKAPSLWAT